MTSNQIVEYINVRNGQLSSDEILQLIDIDQNPQINHIIYENNKWEMWDDKGVYFTFSKRNWN